MEAALAETARNRAKAEIATLTKSRDSLKREHTELTLHIDTAKKDYAAISDKLAIAQKQAQCPNESSTLIELQQRVNAVDIEFRASLPSSVTTASDLPLDLVIEKLFASKAQVRGAAYEELMARFSGSSDLVPKLLTYALGHMNNQNGVYNTLVVLSHLDHQALQSNLDAIRTFANKAKSIGPKTSERSNKLLEKLPH